MQNNSTLLQDVFEPTTSADDEQEAFEEYFSHDYTNGTSNVFDDYPFVKNFFAFMELNEWFIYLLILAITLMVIFLVAAISCWLYKHKNRLIHERTEENIQQSTDEQPGCCAKIFCCCSSSNPDDYTKGGEIVRQNSASNFEAYKRAPLPPMAPSIHGIPTMRVDEKDKRALPQLGS